MTASIPKDHFVLCFDEADIITICNALWDHQTGNPDGDRNIRDLLHYIITETELMGEAK